MPLTLPYLSDLVCKLMAPSPKKACTSATSRSPSWKKVRIWSSSDSSLRRCTPPGRLMLDSISTAFCAACASTFHRRGPTWDEDARVSPLLGRRHRSAKPNRSLDTHFDNPSDYQISNLGTVS